MDPLNVVGHATTSRPCCQRPMIYARRTTEWLSSGSLNRLEIYQMSCCSSLHPRKGIPDSAAKNLPLITLVVCSPHSRRTTICSRLGKALSKSSTCQGSRVMESQDAPPINFLYHLSSSSFVTSRVVYRMLWKVSWIIPWYSSNSSHFAVQRLVSRVPPNMRQLVRPK